MWMLRGTYRNRGWKAGDTGRKISRFLGMLAWALGPSVAAAVGTNRPCGTSTSSCAAAAAPHPLSVRCLYPPAALHFPAVCIGLILPLFPQGSRKPFPLVFLFCAPAPSTSAATSRSPVTSHRSLISVNIATKQKLSEQIPFHLSPLPSHHVSL